MEDRLPLIFDVAAVDVHFYPSDVDHLNNNDFSS